MKCTVSSTTMPRVRAAMTEMANPTCRMVKPHRPNAMAAGARLGIRLMTPSLKLFRAMISMAEMITSAPKEAPSMLWMLRWEMCANMMESPVP